jgi:flagellar basal-body rod modification protein FlgD
VINQTSAAASTAPTASLAAGPGGRMGKDEFLKLFITQLRHQDPMNPMNSEQLAAQLAQFTSVEQLLNISDQLAKQAEINNQMVVALGGANAVNTLGRTVTAFGDRVGIPDGESVTVAVGGNGGTATLKIYDEGGNVIGSRELGAVGPGRQNIPLGDVASGLAPGSYRYGVEVTDAQGTPVPVQSYTTGRVDGIRHGPNGPVLIAGSLEIPLVSVVEITH